MQNVTTWAPTLFTYAAIAAIFYFILWRPQAQQRRRQEELIRTVKRGDEIVTSGGVVGQIVHVQEATAGATTLDDRLTIRSGDARLVVERRSVARVASAPAATQAPAGA